MTGEENVKHVEDGFFKQLKNNDLFSEFLPETFNAQNYANRIIEGHLISDSLSRLTDGINMLNKELMLQVADHHEDLLSQATGIDTLEGVLQSINSRCQSLLKCVERVRTQVTDPYNRIASRTKQLRRLQTTCEYLRRIIRVLQLSKRLQLQLKGGTREITKAAQSLNELGFVTEGVDLTGIKIIEDDLKQIKVARVEIEKKGKQMLEQGLNNTMEQNQMLIGTALQVFYNLGTLEKYVNNLIDQTETLVVESIKSALDTEAITSNQAITSSNTSGPGRTAMPAPANMMSWRAVLWQYMDDLMVKLRDLCQKLYLLEKVLVKKRDPVSHITYIDAFSEDGCSKIFNQFWNTVCSTLRSEFDHATQGSKHLKQAFEVEYPKLLHLFNDFWSQITDIVDKNQLQTGSHTCDIKIGFLEDNSSSLECLKAALYPFENAYLSRSLSRLFDPINLVFPNSALSAPSKDELNSIIKSINNELNIASVDEHLMIMVSKNISKTIQLYINKCEQILVTSPDAGQLTGGLTNSQIRNASICNSLYQLRTGVSEVLPNLVYPPQEAVNVLNESIANMSNFMDIGLSLLLSSVMGSLQNKIARIHTENFSISTSSYHETADAQSCSRYVIDIQEFILRIQSDYFSLYTCQEFLLERLELLACRVLELFVRHASLLRDISEGGKLKLAGDMAQLEFAVTPLCRRFEDLGSSYKLFRAFRPLLFQSVEDIPSNPSLGDSLPYNIVLHFLFSKAPVHMLSPHTVAGWTVPQYSEWLDDHPNEEEKLALIRGTLEAFAQKKRGNEDDFPAVYTIMIKLFKQQQNL